MADHNAEGTDSLEAAIASLGTPRSLPVITIGDPDRLLRDRDYAQRVAAQLDARLGHSKSIVILDDEAWLATCAHSDLNRWAAGIAPAPDASPARSVHSRAERCREQDQLDEDHSLARNSLARNSLARNSLAL